MNYIDFYNELLSHRLITPIWKYILDLIENEIKNVEEKDIYLNIFAIYFSLIDSGNATISLDCNVLKEKWNASLEDAKVLSNDEEDDCICNFENIDIESNRIIKDEYLSNIINLTDIVGKNKIFEVDNNYLYLKKYNHARLGIIESINRLFLNNSFNNKKVFDINTTYKDINKFKLSSKQLEVVDKGLNNNLIVTGGPGTGKTTSILYILLYILSNSLDYNIYLTAASGKASSRMKESIVRGLDNLNSDFLDNNKNVIGKIKGTLDNDSNMKTEEFTIHRLLSLDFNTGLFKYNKNNQFKENSIFIIDEASMIDITLFNSLLEAIPTGARVFILGDKNQLPSVEVGAVFSDLLNYKGISKVELDESKRFGEDTIIFDLANKINNGLDLGLNDSIFEDPNNFEIKKLDKKKCPVFYYKNDSNNKQKEQKIIIENILNKWCKEFYPNVQNDCSNISVNTNLDSFKHIFEYTDNAKILCAENMSVRGVKQINNYIKKKVITNDNTGLNGHYSGEVMMISKNNKLLDLYNGDTGILVTFENDDTLYFMVQKASKLITKEEYKKDNIFMLCGYVFYPFRLISLSEIDLAFAITVHKSQGSDYNSILVVLPTAKGHPLLNRQILYTAITRTKGNTYILSSLDSLNEGKDRVIVRDTNIIL